MNENAECRLTTIDNPFDPFTQFDEWFLFDTEKGYNSCSRLDRVTYITDDMSEAEVNEEIERAIDDIVKHDILNIFKKATKQTTEEK